MDAFDVPPDPPCQLAHPQGSGARQRLEDAPAVRIQRR
jgi:hypothetical protein